MAKLSLFCFQKAAIFVSPVFEVLDSMKTLSIEQLNALRIAVFDNAEALHREAKVLLQYGMHARAYLLAHFCFEELGKIPIIVGVIAKLQNGEVVDWKKVQKRFYSHEQKIASQNGHFYTFGLDVDLIRDSDLHWLTEANARVANSFRRKNLATYIDVADGEMLRPTEQISRDDAHKLVQFAFECLQAHWHSEGITNPLVYGKDGATPDAV